MSSAGRYFWATRRSRIPYLSRRPASDDTAWLTQDRYFRLIVSSGAVRDRANADRLLRQHQLANYRELAVWLQRQHRQRHRRPAGRRLMALLRRLLNISAFDLEKREYRYASRHKQRPMKWIADDYDV
jgi:hypothetical protein